MQLSAADSEHESESESESGRSVFYVCNGQACWKLSVCLCVNHDDHYT